MNEHRRLPEEERINPDIQTPVPTINITELFYYLVAKLHFIIAGAAFGSVILGLYAGIFARPIYTATAKIYILGQTGSSIISDLQIGAVLTMDYREVFKTWEIHEMVNQRLGLNYSYSELQKMLTVENPNDTRILYITVQNTDPQLAADIANAYVASAKRFITQIMVTDEPSSFSVALVPGTASGIGITGFAIRGFLFGTILAGGILFLIFILDNRPKSPEDIQRYANIPTLAVIPISPEYIEGGKRRRRPQA